MKSSQFVDALTNDIEGNATASLPETTEESKPVKGDDLDAEDEPEVAKEEAKKGAEGVQSAFDEMQEKLKKDIDNLV